MPRVMQVDTLVKLSHYKLHKQKSRNISLVGEGELPPIKGGGAAAKDPEKELLSEILGHMNALFEGELSDEDMINYANTIKDKVLENTKVIEQVSNNTNEQAMMGGFVAAINSAVIESLEVHRGMATQMLSQERLRDGLADIVYAMIAQGLSKAKTTTQKSSYSVNTTLDPTMIAAESKPKYGKREE